MHLLHGLYAPAAYVIQIHHQAKVLLHNMGSRIVSGDTVSYVLLEAQFNHILLGRTGREEFTWSSPSSTRPSESGTFLHSITSR